MAYAAFAAALVSSISPGSSATLAPSIPSSASSSSAPISSPPAPTTLFSRNYAAGSGLAEVKTILGGFLIKDLLGPRTLVAKTFGLPFTVASGLAVGKEGAMIHLAACIGDIVSRLFDRYERNEAKRREIISGFFLLLGT